MFVPHPALREHAFSWTNGVKKSLGFLHINTVPPRVLNALTMIDTYGCATKKMSHEKEDVCHVASLLLALDLHLGSWPEVLQQQVQVTPVTLNGVTIHVSRPLIEAVIVLYNGAIALLEHGLELLSHVRADAVRRTSLAGSSGLPNVNAKRAFQSITAAQELAEMADHTLRSGKERNLSKAEQTSLTAHLDLSTLRDTCVVCAASAKYIFALSSAATATNPEALSKLAFIAASYSIPERLPNTSTLKLLPTVLLAAFHVHRGEQYYAEEEMGKALGHIQYANRILLNTTEEAVKSQQFHQSSWRSVLTAVKKVLSVKGGDGSLTFECDDDASEEVQKAAEAYTKLAKIVENSDDILRVLPYFHILLKTQFNLLCKYEKENKVVYFEKTLPADTVRRDVPDIEALVPTTGDIKTITVSQQSTDALKELPSEQELLYLLTQQSEREKAIQNTARLVRGLEGVMNTVTSKVELPAEAGDALHQLEPCLQEHNSTVEGALQLAQEELQTAYDAYETAVEQWQTAKGGKKTSHPTQKAVDAAVNLWSKDTEKILASWSKSVGNGHTSLEDIKEVLYPVNAYLEEYLVPATTLLEEARKATSSGTVSEALDSSLLKAVEEGNAALTALDKLQTTLKRQSLPVLRQAAELLWGAPGLLKEVQDMKVAVEEDTKDFSKTPEKQTKKKETGKGKSPSHSGTKRKRIPEEEERAPSSSTEAYSASTSVHSSQLGTPREEPQEEEITEAKVSKAMLAKLRAKRALKNNNNAKKDATESAKKTEVKAKPKAKAASKKK